MNKFVSRVLLALSIIALAAASSPPSKSSPDAAKTDGTSSFASSIEWTANKLHHIFSEALNATTATAKGRGAKSGFDGSYAMWNPAGAGKFDVLSLIPTLLIVGIGIMLLPVILSCFTQIIAPMTYSNGRKKRDVSGLEHPFLGASPTILLDLMGTFQKAMGKYGF